MFSQRDTVIPGCVELVSNVREDARGRFVKTVHAEVFKNKHLSHNFREQYYSVSNQNVLRGLHFQVPPHDHDKLVYCPSGSVLDTVVDLRRGSPTFLQHILIELSEDKANSLYIPAGLAHGFLTLSQTALLVYNVTTEYSPEHDAGVLWTSASIPWPVVNPIVSERDRGLPAMADFDSPFSYEGGFGSPTELSR